MERVLLLTMGFGTGHNAAAKALEAEFSKVPGVEAETVDLLQLIPKSLHPLVQSGYHGMLAKVPFFYHYLYDWTYQSKVIRQLSSEIIEKLGRTIRKKVLSLLNEFNPTRIVTTHPFSLLLLPPIWRDIPTVGVVTDYELHPMWVVQVPDVLCVPKKLLDEQQMEQLTWKSGCKVIETGIPIQPRYYQTIPREQAREELALPATKPVVLVMGGGMGLGPMEQMVMEMSSISDIQFVVFTGRNEALLERLSKRLFASPVRLLGYCDQVDLYMSAADLLVTKPGGITITEAIAKRLPMFLFQAFPGQEEANQAYLVKHRVAVITRLATVCLQLDKQFLVGFNSRQCVDRFEGIISSDSASKILEATFALTPNKIYML
ncbi:processive 1,2-diacylglycerol beta-glucosyltransferase [Thermoactinomyces sp. DSM 45891]|uniref:MGDG synthase family glycosyltransferase n=1 Tax=Thermoactinomyces sp. DSM 45891 TaxID=1761907 RepID=UPI0009242667|nr:glycosyltransferase [Thermoactinomyces sp. DSM 45891]SFX72509.1 processive 1,2-diacylglycerol beta-glucosyltransferase [Thermoactinomyces sp. DSM 45891]